MTQKTDNGVVTNYIYNQEDRLTRVENGSSTIIAEYYYDPFGRRLWKDVGGTRTHSHYAREGLIGEYSSSGTETKAYGYRPYSTWTTNPIFMKEGGNYYFYQNDKLGTMKKMTAINGAVVWSAKYTSFGEARVSPFFPIMNNLRFPGQYYDSETGLHYNWNRYYDPSTGRYLRTDPAYDGLNLYVYVRNNPLRYLDPRGLTTFNSNSSVGSYDYNNPLDLSLDLSFTSQDLADASAYLQYEQEYEAQRKRYLESIEAQAHMARVQRHQEILSPSTLPIQQIFRPTSESPNFFSESRLLEGNVNTYGLSVDAYDGFGGGGDFGIYHDRINNEIGFYINGEIGYGLDNGLDYEVGAVDSVQSMNGVYTVTEMGVLGMSMNTSTSLDNGRTTTTINGPIFFPDNAGLPAGHAGVGYGHTIPILNWN